MATLTLADVMKAGRGEGSRGGRIIGHTRSGKPVYAGRHASHTSYRDFTSQDHEDAAWLHAVEQGKAEDKAKRAYLDVHRSKEALHDRRAEAHNARAVSHFARADQLASPVSKAGTGEGSRGGRIIGHTRSGKPVYASKDSRHLFAVAEHPEEGAERTTAHCASRGHHRTGNFYINNEGYSYPRYAVRIHGLPKHLTDESQIIDE